MVECEDRDDVFAWTDRKYDSFRPEPEGNGVGIMWAVVASMVFWVLLWGMC
jgi:hypothetical protein